MQSPPQTTCADTAGAQAGDKLMIAETMVFSPYSSRVPSLLPALRRIANKVNLTTWEIDKLFPNGEEIEQ